MGQIKSKSCGSSFSNEISLGFYSGQHLEQQNEQPKADWPEGTIKAYAGCSRIIATIQRASSTGLPAESGSGEGQAVLRVQTAKKRPFSLTQNQPPKTGKVAAMGGVGGTRGRIHETSCSVVISARRE